MDARRHRTLWPYVLTALLALLAALGALVMGGITPFGEGTLAWQDNGQQVASDFGYLRGVAQGRSSLDWSYACGGSPRSALHPTFNNLCSPLTWAVAAIPGLPALTALSLLILLQLALLPLGALFYVRRSFPCLPTVWGMVLALCYAFGGFVLTKHSFLPFLNIALLFPWFVAALDELLRRGRWLPCTLLLALLLSTATYFAYMYGLFAAVYAASRTGWRWRSPVRQHSLLLVGATAGALALSAFSWLPSLMVTAGSARAGEAAMLWHMTRATLQPAIWHYLAGLPAALLALLLLVCRQLRWNRYALTLAVLVVGLLFSSATTLWHVSMPWDFAGRFAYMASFMLICIVAQAACRGWLGRWPFSCSLSVGVVLMTAIFCSISLGLQLRQEAREHGHSYQASADRVLIAEWAARMQPQAEGRAKARGHAAIENLAFITPFDSLSHFTACITRAQQQTLPRWGYQERAAVISNEGGTLASDTLLGVRCILTQESRSNPPLRSLATCHSLRGHYRLEENPWYAGMGCMLPQGALPLNPQQRDPIGYQQALLAALLGDQHAGQRSEGRVGEALSLPPDCLHYLQHEGRFHYVGHPYERWGGVEDPPGLWELPPGKAVKGEPGSRFSLYHLPLASLDALEAFMSELPVQVAYEGRIMVVTCRSTAVRPLLFLPFLWQAGYEATVDGKPVSVLDVGGWVGLLMPHEGEHRAELHYRAPGRVVGWLITACALPLLLLAWLKTRCRAPLARQGMRETLCRRALLLLTLLLLTWPLLVLPIGLWWR